MSSSGTSIMSTRHGVHSKTSPKDASVSQCISHAHWYTSVILLGLHSGVSWTPIYYPTKHARQEVREPMRETQSGVALEHGAIGPYRGCFGTVQFRGREDGALEQSEKNFPFCLDRTPIEIDDGVWERETRPGVNIVEDLEWKTLSGNVTPGWLPQSGYPRIKYGRNLKKVMRDIPPRDR